MGSRGLASQRFRVRVEHVPRNVRELENAIERAVVLTRRSRIDIEICQRTSASPYRTPSGRLRSVRSAEVERDYVKSEPRAVGGHRSQAAQKLGIGEATLYRKIKRLGDG